MEFFYDEVFRTLQSTNQPLRLTQLGKIPRPQAWKGSGKLRKALISRPELFVVEQTGPLTHSVRLLATTSNPAPNPPVGRPPPPSGVLLRGAPLEPAPPQVAAASSLRASSSHSQEIAAIFVRLQKEKQISVGKKKMAMLMSRPDLFAAKATGMVQLVKGASLTPPSAVASRSPSAAPAPKPLTGAPPKVKSASSVVLNTPPAHEAFTNAVFASLQQRGGRLDICQLGDKTASIHRPTGIKIKPLLLSRPDLFEVTTIGSQSIVTLVQSASSSQRGGGGGGGGKRGGGGGVGGGAQGDGVHDDNYELPPRDGCGTCKILSFRNSFDKEAHFRSRAHRENVLRRCFAPHFGVSLVGAEELSCVPNVRATMNLVLTNAGQSGCTVQCRGLSLLKSRPDVRLSLSSVDLSLASALLPPGASEIVAVDFYSTQPCATNAVILCLCSVNGLQFTLGHKLRLRCSPVIEDCLKPTSPFQRKARRRRFDDKTDIVEGPAARSKGRDLRLPKVSLDAMRRKFTSDRAFLEASLSVALSPLTYSFHFGDLLKLEEVQQEEDIKEYSLEQVTMRRNPSHGGTLELHVPGLSEARPSVMKGDKVTAKHPSLKDRYRGTVVHANEESVLLEFHPHFHRVFVDGMKFDVDFTVRRTPALLMHSAVQAAVASDGLLFPQILDQEQELAASAAVSRATLSLANPSLNERQQLAVRAAQASAAITRGAPYLIFGPPGTGKTSTLVEYVFQEWKKKQGTCLMLVAAPSNSASDVLTHRLLQVIPARSIRRCNAFQRSKSAVPGDVLTVSNWSEESGGFSLPEEPTVGVSIFVCTCTTARKLVLTWKLPPRQQGLLGGFLSSFMSSKPKFDGFSHVCIDEAGQSTEPECLCAISGALLPAGRVVLAGDPKQLGPVLRSTLASEKGLGTSLLERLISNPVFPHSERVSEPLPEGCFDGFHHCYTTMLNKNYRSHPALLRVPNDLFYRGRLEACADPMRVNAFCNFSELTEVAKKIPGGFPYIFHGVEGEDMREGNSPSWFNPIEATECLSYIKKVLAHRGGGVKASDIGVITPYHKQSMKIKELLRKQQLAGVQVGSVELFQGGEKDVIILSAVRSSPDQLAADEKHALGFLKNPKRFNVAVTRAKALLVIIGNPFILARDPCWRRAIDYAKTNGAYKGCDFSLDDVRVNGGSGGSEGSEGGGGGEEDELQRNLDRLHDEEAELQAAVQGPGEGDNDDDDENYVAVGREMPAWDNEAH